jgi:metallophosphoesterase (TIGR00282 family)
LRILFLADIVGRPGRRALTALLPALRQQLTPDFVIANAENAAAGWGITAGTAEELLAAGVDCLTSGNHVWEQAEARTLLEQEPRLLRPANYPPGCPGQGARIYCCPAGVPVAVINLQGRVFMQPIDCPFRVADGLLAQLAAEAKVIFVDFHAEATSEKQAMGWHLDGRVSAVVGTHTHVQTADERILPSGTAYLTDAGMCGPLDSVIGAEINKTLGRFLTGLPARFEVPKRGPVVVQGAVVDVDERSGRALHIERINLVWQAAPEQDAADTAVI